MKLKKFKEKKIFVTGVSGSGKTYFATKYAEKFYYPYIDFEENWGGYQAIIDVVQQYNDMIEKYPEEFITDAIPYTILNGKLLFLDYLEKNKSDIKIVCVCCTNKDEYDKRIENKSYSTKSQAYNEYLMFYYNSMNLYYSLHEIQYYDTYTNEFISKEELYKRIKWILKYDLKDYINLLTYDKYYQDIECINFVGYAQSFKTWENIKDLVDWKGKTVADLGCFHGYFAFKVAKAGAKRVVGMDISQTVLDTTNIINEIEGNIIETKIWAGGQEVSKEFDVSLCLNLIHHFPNIREALNNIKSKIVIFEANSNLVDEISKEFKIIKRMKSHRGDINNIPRIILLCEKK